MNETLQINALNDLKKSSSVELITNDQFIHGDTKTNMTNFINDTTVLKGEQWDSVRNKMSLYNKMLEKRSKVAANLSLAINDAVKVLLDYLGDDLYLDPSKLEEIKHTKQQCENLIADLESSINSKQQVEKVDEQGNSSFKTEYIYSYAEREEFRNKINELRNETIPKLNKLIAKIEGLPEIYEKAKEIIRTAYSEIESFSNEVNSITPSDKVNFVV